MVSGMYEGLRKKKINGYEVLKNRGVYQFREEKDLEEFGIMKEKKKKNEGI